MLNPKLDSPAMDAPTKAVEPRSSPQPPPGFRLRRLEMLNWGTFHHRLGVLAPNGWWTLVVGENGSGKSTAVDALRTLLVPPRSLNYNDASGEQKRRDRTRRSYIRGAWATSSQEDSAAAKVEYLRKPGEQSILLAVFADEQSGTEATLVQVLWETNEKIDEAFAVARGDRNIREHLTDLGKSNELKKTLRSRGFEPLPSFAAYEETFRARLGIPGRGALEVFNQAIGVKEVTDINSFIRRHMLEPSEVVEFITDHIRPHYRELDACWQAIQKAKKQITELDPIADCHRRMEDAKARKQELETLQQVAPLYYTHLHLELRQREAERLEREIAESQQRQGALQDAQTADDQQRTALELELADGVGLRIKEIEIEQRTVNALKKEKEDRHETIRSALLTLQISVPFDTAEAFQAMRAQLEAGKGLLDGNLKSARQKRIEAEIEERDALKLRGQLAAELQSLRHNRVLIPREYLEIRQTASEACGIPIAHLPFAGELLEVKTEFREWTGVIERLLRSFGISLLVPQRYSLQISRFVNSRHLGLRLTYHRVPEDPAPCRLETLRDRERVPSRLNFREEHALHSWVKTEICRRFHHVCCPDEDRLDREEFGITREGLIRSGPTQHIKDDRRFVNDVTSYVLGWSIEMKIRALTKEYDAAEKAATDARRRAATMAQQIVDLEGRLQATSQVLSVNRFADVDFRSEQERLHRLEKERQELEASSDRRKTLMSQLKDVKQRIWNRQQEILGEAAKGGGFLQEKVTNDEQISRLGAILAPHDHSSVTTSEESLHALQEERVVTLKNVDDVAAAVGRRLQNRINQQTSAISRASDEMLPAMAEFLRDYPEETADKKAAADYAADFVALQERLRNEDLPRHEQEFEKFLSLNLIGDMAMFSTKLRQHQEDIESRISTVNAALKKIAFSNGTHVQIISRSKSASDETAAFRAELRACLAGGLNPSAQDRVRIFGLIRELIAKFEKDEAWMRRVTDVRNWLEFGVQEYADADGAKLNYYAASTGKSGGQKTKLAFTILASAITAQYGLAEATDNSATFRLVVIDEAFARTDEANSERALKLFQSLGLQLLVVSPFDAKSRIVEDYVDSFHLAVNPEGSNSHIRLVSREEYDSVQEKTEHAQDGGT